MTLSIAVSSNPEPARAISDVISAKQKNIDTNTNFLTFTDASAITSKDVSPRALANLALAKYSSTLGLRADEWSYSLYQESIDHMLVLKFGQVLKGLPVEGSSVVLTVNSDNELVSSRVSSADFSGSTTPAVSTAKARAVATVEVGKRNNIAATQLRVRESQLLIVSPEFSPGVKTSRLAYRLEVDGVNGLHVASIWIDAQNQSVLNYASLIKQVQVPNACDAHGNSSTKDGTTETYWLGPSNGLNGKNLWPAEKACSHPITSANQLQPIASARTIITKSINDIADVYTPLMATYTSNSHVDGTELNDIVGNNIDGSQSTYPMSVVINYCSDNRTNTSWPDATCPYANAFWTAFNNSTTNIRNGGDRYLGGMFIGEGLDTGEDVFAHEVTHGVSGYLVQTPSGANTDYGFNYVGESGAIDESYSDIFGQSIQVLGYGAFSGLTSTEQTDVTSWTIGEKISPSVGFALPLRVMSDPTRNRDPDRISSRYFHTCSGNDLVDSVKTDNCYVHSNSGVLNKFAWLATTGGAFNGQVVPALHAYTAFGDDDYRTSVAMLDRLMFDVMLHVTSSESYAELGLQIASSCSALATQSAAGFTSETCTGVNKALLATELIESPSPVLKVSAEGFYCGVKTDSLSVHTDTALTLSGTIRLVDGAVDTGRKYVVQYSTDGIAAYSDVTAVLTVGSSSAVQVNVPTPSEGKYRLMLLDDSSQPTNLYSAPVAVHLDDTVVFKRCVATMTVAVTKTSVARGYAVTFTSYVKSKGNGQAISGVSTRLQYRIKGTTTWRTAKTVRSLASGKVTASFTPSKTSYYRFSVPSTTNLTGTTSTKLVAVIVR